MIRWSAVLITCAIAGCGARSGLYEGRAGSGGAPTTSTTSGTGGMDACAPLAITGPVRTLPAVPGYHARRPALVKLGGGPAEAIVIALDAVESPGPVPSPIADVVIEPWGAWPEAIDPPHPIAPSGGAAFAVAPRTQPTFALAASMEQTGELPNVTFAKDVDPHGTADLEPLTLPQQGLVRFIAANANAALTLIGLDVALDPPLHAGRTILDPYSPGYSFIGLACAAGEIVADAVPSGNGFLAALSTSIPITSCPGTGFQPTPAVDIRIFRGSSQYTPHDILLSHPIDRVRLVGRKAGAWVISQTRDWGGTIEPIRVDGITDEGAIDYAVTNLAPVPGKTLGFGAAAYGEGFALAWIADPPAIGVGVFGPDGIAIATTLLPIAAGAMLPDAPVIAVADDRSALIVSWTESAVGEPAVVRVARFGCLIDL